MLQGAGRRVLSVVIIDQRRAQANKRSQHIPSCTQHGAVHNADIVLICNTRVFVIRSESKNDLFEIHIARACVSSADGGMCWWSVGGPRARKSREMQRNVPGVACVCTIDVMTPMVQHRIVIVQHHWRHSFAPCPSPNRSAGRSSTSRRASLWT